MSREKRLAKRILKKDTNPHINTQIASNMVLPNHSGDHSRGKVFRTPVDDYHIANKKYVDDNSGGAPEGTAVKSTGESVGVFLGADGDNTSSWQTIATSDLPVGNAGEQLTVNEAETELEFSLASKYLPVRNTTGSTLNPGQPVYINGYNVGNSAITVALADASASSTMPAVGLVFESIANNTNGRVIISGNTTGIVDTSSWSVGDAIYVSETTGTLTNVKPTGTALIQKIGTVGRSSAVNGQLTVVGAGRSNDVPNLGDGNVWVGNASGVATAVALSGDVTVSNAGVTAIGSGVIVNADVDAAAAISVSKTALVAGTNCTLSGDTLNVDDAFLVNNADDTSTGKITAANFAVTGDNNTNDTTYVPMVLHGTDATPPTASTVPRGTIYIQYTA